MLIIYFLSIPLYVISLRARYYYYYNRFNPKFEGVNTFSLFHAGSPWIFRDIFIREFERWFFIKTRYIYFFLLNFRVFNIFIWEYRVENCKWKIRLRYIYYIFKNFKSKYCYKHFRISFCGVKFNVEFFVIGIFRGEQRGGISKIRLRLYLGLP